MHRGRVFTAGITLACAAEWTGASVGHLSLVITTVLATALVVVTVVMVAGVVLPAVFFTEARRRRDARAVLRQICDVIRPRRSP